MVGLATRAQSLIGGQGFATWKAADGPLFYPETSLLDCPSPSTALKRALRVRDSIHLYIFPVFDFSSLALRRGIAGVLIHQSISTGCCYRFRSSLLLLRAASLAPGSTQHWYRTVSNCGLNALRHRHNPLQDGLSHSVFTFASAALPPPPPGGSGFGSGVSATYIPTGSPFGQTCRPIANTC